MSDPSSDELRRLLLDAAAGDDLDMLERLCREHEEAILAHFPQWRTMPPGVRDVPPLAERYGQGLVAIAQCFEQRLGRPELLRLLMGTPENNPLARWQRTLDQAQKLMEEVRFAEAASLLTDCFIDVRGLKGSGVAAYLPVTFGLLGECHFQAGEAARAVPPTEKALELCTQAGDAEGVAAYLGNLYEIHRYLGDAETAAACADRLADALERQGNSPEAGRYRKQARLVRAGEPRNRVIADVDGRRFEMDEVLTGTPGRVQFAFERNRLTLRPAQVLTERGKQAAGAGNFEEALDLFRQAARADRWAPDPHYQAGLTLLYLERYEEGAAQYEETEELAPGWFHCRSHLWLARQLALGRLNQAVFRLYHVLEDGPLSPRQKVDMAERALRQVPALAFIHRARGKALQALGQPAGAEAAFREGLRCVEEPDLQTRLLVDLAAVTGDAGEKNRLLRQAADLQGNLVGAATAAVLLAFGEGSP